MLGFTKERQISPERSTARKGEALLTSEDLRSSMLEDVAIIFKVITKSARANAYDKEDLSDQHRVRIITAKMRKE
jgi:hypothetical protein